MVMTRVVRAAVAAAICLAVAPTTGASALSISSKAPSVSTGSAPSLAASASSGVESWSAGGLIETTTSPLTRPSAASSGFAQVGGCTFYATSASAGGFCSSGGVTGRVQSLAAWLAGRKFYPCKYFELPEGMYVNAPIGKHGRWMLLACFEEVDLTQPWGGTDVQIDLMGQWVTDEEIADGLTKTKGYMNQFWDIQSDRNYYPLPRFTPWPSHPFRVGGYSYFSASWIEALNSEKRTEPEFNVAYQTTSQGTVYLHAEIAKVTIDPGIDGMDPIDCGIADVPFDREARDSIPRSEGGDQDSECWTRYEHSTAAEDKRSVNITADAMWHVEVNDAAGNQLAELGDFTYSVRQRVAVAEVQPLVDW